MPAATKSNRVKPSSSKPASGKPDKPRSASSKGVKAQSISGKSNQDQGISQSSRNRHALSEPAIRATSAKSSARPKASDSTVSRTADKIAGTSQKVKTASAKSEAKSSLAAKTKSSEVGKSLEAVTSVSSKRVTAASRRTAKPAAAKEVPAKTVRSRVESTTTVARSSKAGVEVELKGTAVAAKQRSSKMGGKPATTTSLGIGRSSGSAKLTNSSRSAGRSIDKVVPAAERAEIEVSNSPNDIIEARPLNPQWLQIRWSLSKATLHRAMSAMAEDWHAAKPTLRLLDVTDNDSVVCSNCIVRDIIVGPRDHLWFTHVEGPGRSYRVVVGFSNGAKFHPSAKSLTIHMDDAIAQHGKSGGSLGGSLLDWPETTTEQHSNGNELTDSQLASLAAHHSRENSAGALISSFQLSLESELMIHGTTHPLAKLTLMGKPTPVSPEGRFQLRMNLLPGRQVIPAVAIDPNGGEERTIVLAIDISSRELEPRNYDDPNNAN